MMKREIRPGRLVFSCAMLVGSSMASAAATKAPQIDAVSSRSVDDLAGCVALEAANFHGYELRKARLDRGLELKLRFRVAGIAATAATIRIEDGGEQRRLSGHATGKASGAPRTFLERIRNCAVEPLGTN